MKSFLKFAIRPDNIVLVICLCLFAAVVAHGENGPTPQIVVGSSGIVDGSVTPAKISSGYNLLTDAEKTQALTGSSTVDFSAQNLTSNGSVAFTSANFLIKSAELTLADGESANVATILDITGSPWGELFITGNTFGGGSFLLVGAANNAIVGDAYTGTAVGDTPATVSVIPAGSGMYIIKNNLRATATMLIFYKGIK